MSFCIFSYYKDVTQYVLIVVIAKLPSHVQLFETPWTVAHQTLQSMGFPRQKYWSRLPFPSLGDLSDPGIKVMPPELAGGFFTTEPPGKPQVLIRPIKCSLI